MVSCVRRVLCGVYGLSSEVLDTGRFVLLTALSVHRCVCLRVCVCMLYLVYGVPHLRALGA